MGPIRTLLIDNYDSYTYNLFQQISTVNGVPPVVFRNDEIDIQAIKDLIARRKIENVIISPGPGTPGRQKDVGVSLDIMKKGVGCPVLGVCLGMQALAHACGASVVRGPEPVHGRLSNVRHTGHRLFDGIPSGPIGTYTVVRYHSLVVDEATLPAKLVAIAWTCGGHQAVRPTTSLLSMGQQSLGGDVLMALAHTCEPLYGVQFHPESVATSFGNALLTNFRDMTAAHHGLPLSHGLPPAATNGHSEHQETQQNRANLDVRWRCMNGAMLRDDDSQSIFQSLYGSTGGHDAFWLDSAATDRGRFSYMGGREGLLWRRITYSLPAIGAPSVDNPGTVCTEDVSGRTSEVRTLWWPYLEQLLSDFCCFPNGANGRSQLPFDFWGGLVGYLGYELKAECGAAAPFRSSLPDAAFFLVDRVIALDHRTGDLYLMALSESRDAVSIASADTWIRDREAQIAQVLQQPQPAALKSDQASQGGSVNGHVSPTANGHSKCASGRRLKTDGETVDRKHISNGHRGDCEQQARPAPLEPFRLHRTRDTYVADVQACKDALYAGESYELCLTTALSRRSAAPHNALDLYYTLRRVSPAPYAAFMSFGDGGPQVCCSSPERFLRGSRNGDLEARPIKGTAARCQDAAADAAAAAALAASEKDQAENLMIVDLLRNDLGRVCEVGSVHVPVLMEVESYAVHSLVSTVRGRRKPEASIVQCLQATFPGGSMTGAPKLRSMEILDRLEKEARGVYSGSLGFIGFNNAFDLNIVIRTAILDGDVIRIGAGGAVVVQSDPEAEYEEMRLKAFALMRAIGEFDGRKGPAAVEESVLYAHVPS